MYKVISILKSEAIRCFLKYPEKVMYHVLCLCFSITPVILPNRTRLLSLGYKNIPIKALQCNTLVL